MSDNAQSTSLPQSSRPHAVLLHLKDWFDEPVAAALIEVYTYLEEQGVDIRSDAGVLTGETRSLLQRYPELTPELGALLDLYNEFYREASAAFPNQDELEGPIQYLTYLGDDEDPLRIAVMADTDSGRLLGAVHFQVFDVDAGLNQLLRFAIAENFWVPEDLRPQQVAWLLVTKAHQLAEDLEVRLIFGEYDDPLLMRDYPDSLAGGPSFIRPEVRARFYNWPALGMRQINAPYIQPAVEEGSRPVLHLSAMIRVVGLHYEEIVRTDATGDYITRQLYLALLSRVFDYDCLGAEVIRATHPVYLQIEALLGSRDRLYLLPTTEPRTFHQ